MLTVQKQDQKALLPFTLSLYPSLADEIPEKYHFESATDPATQRPDFPLILRQDSWRSNPQEFQTQRPPISAIVERYFNVGCDWGLNTAVENLFCLVSLKLGIERWMWYRDEVAVLHGALMIAIRYKLLIWVQKIAWYVTERGIDLLNIADEVRLGSRREHMKVPKLVEEALSSGSFQIAQTVIGYRNSQEKQVLERSIRDRMIPSQETSHISNEDLLAISDTVGTVVNFWKRPAVQRRLPADSPFDKNLGFMSWGFGSNIDDSSKENTLGPSVIGEPESKAGETEANVDAAQNPSVSEEAKALEELLAQLTATVNEKPGAYDGDRRTNFRPSYPSGPQTNTTDLQDATTSTTMDAPRVQWLSHSDLSRDIAILHGGRNRNVVRLEPVDPSSPDLDFALTTQLSQWLNRNNAAWDKIP